MSRYIVGDIHGCFDTLQALLAEVGFEPGCDDLWAVGDLIGRGPKALKTLSYLHQLGDSFQCTLGNHDLHFLAVAAGLRPVKTQDRTQEILDSEQARQLIDWLRHQPLTLRDIESDIFVSHAGIPPQWSVADTQAYAQEVEHVIQGPALKQLLTTMYGNEPSMWHSSLPENDRYRFIINALTRMRYCRPDGALELATKSSPQQEEPAGLKPWYTFRPVENTTLFFGHWAALSGKTGRKDIIGLDTGCVWGERLTLHDCSRNERISIPARD